MAGCKRIKSTASGLGSRSTGLWNQSRTAAVTPLCSALGGPKRSPPHPLVLSDRQRMHVARRNPAHSQPHPNGFVFRGVKHLSLLEVTPTKWVRFVFFARHTKDSLFLQLLQPSHFHV